MPGDGDSFLNGDLKIPTAADVDIKIEMTYYFELDGVEKSV